MNNTLKNTLSYILGAILVFSAVALAGTLTPGVSTSTPTMYTLSDIYSKIQNINFTPSVHTVSTTSSPTTGTFNTLSEIYTALNDLDYTASDIATGTSIMGITGNITIPAEADVRLSTTYGPNNTLTGEMSAGAAPLEWSADNPAGYVDWATAGAYCSVTLGNGYRLPHMWELAQYYQQNGAGSFQAGYYWSSTEYPDDPDFAYGVYVSNGYVDFYGKTSPNYLARCAR
jgi:hypothetical protein